MKPAFRRAFAEVHELLARAVRAAGSTLILVTHDRQAGAIADRVVRAREDAWQDLDEQDRKVRRTLGIASLGGATLDNEENYLIRKSFTAMGAVQIENQARI